MESKPIWLLDFDGVLNAIAPRGDTLVWGDWRVALRGDDFEGIPWHLWSPSATEVVAEAVSAGVRVIWLTDWMEMTQRLHEAIPNLPPRLEFLTCRIAGPSRQWKVNAAMATVPDDVPLLWADDQLKTRLMRERAAREWVRDRAGSTTMITPRKHCGITPSDVSTIREWMAGVTR